MPFSSPLARSRTSKGNCFRPGSGAGGFRRAGNCLGASLAYAESVKSIRGICVVLVTAPDLKTARRLARVVIEARLVACVNVIPRVESHYWWQGKIEFSAEVLLVMKTTTARLPELERRLVAEHPYDTPEIVTLPLGAGNARYLGWLVESVRQVG